MNGPPIRPTLGLSRGVVPRAQQRPSPATEAGAATGTASSPAPPQAPVGADLFWLIWRIGGRAPTRRHLSLASAQTEAARLRDADRRALFCVYEARLVDMADPELADDDRPELGLEPSV
jgi:hypothetical protein